MGWLHSTAPIEAKATIPVDPFGISRPNLDGVIYPDSNYYSYGRDGFGRNELVYACIMKKARTAPQGVLRVYGGMPEPLDDHRLRRLWERPNPVTNEVEFLQLSIVHLDLSGNCYWLIEWGRDGLPAELWPIRPDLIRVIPNAARPRDWRYGYVVDSAVAPSRGSTMVIPIERRDLIHIKYPNPLDPFFGQAPMRPATRAVSLDNARTDYVDTLLRNDAVPRVVIKTQEELDDTVVGKLTERWMRRHGGQNRGRPAFLQVGVEVQTLGLNLEELEFGDLSGVAESRICMSFGVQPILVGAKVGLDRSTFANFHEAAVDLWETTIMDIQSLMNAGISTQLVPFFNGVGRQRVATRWDNSGVLALQEAATERWERTTNAVARGLITVNDGRRELGLDPVPGGDVFLIPAGVTVTPARQIAAAPQPAETDEETVEEPEEEAPPEREAASYAEAFLAGLSHNGHRPRSGVAQ